MIGDRDFRDIYLSNVDMPEVIQIGVSAFSSTPLTNIALNKVERIGSFAFYDINLTSLTLLNTLKTIEESAFINTFKEKYISVRIPESVTFLGNNAFSHNEKLNSSSVLSSQITEVSYRFLEESVRLTNENFSDNITSISDYAFYNTGMQTARFQEVKSIGAADFASSRIQNVSFLKLEEIKQDAFRYSGALKNRKYNCSCNNREYCF